MLLLPLQSTGLCCWLETWQAWGAMAASRDNSCFQLQPHTNIMQQGYSTRTGLGVIMMRLKPSRRLAAAAAMDRSLWVDGPMAVSAARCIKAAARGRLLATLPLLTTLPLQHAPHKLPLPLLRCRGQGFLPRLGLTAGLQLLQLCSHARLVRAQHKHAGRGTGGVHARHAHLCVYVVRLVSRVGQDHIGMVYIRYYWQGNHELYSHIRCIYMVLANLTCEACVHCEACQYEHIGRAQVACTRTHAYVCAISLTVCADVHAC